MVTEKRIGRIIPFGLKLEVGGIFFSSIQNGEESSVKLPSKSLVHLKKKILFILGKFLLLFLNIAAWQNHFKSKCRKYIWAFPWIFLWTKTNCLIQSKCPNCFISLESGFLYEGAVWEKSSWIPRKWEFPEEMPTWRLLERTVYVPCAWRSHITGSLGGEIWKQGGIFVKSKDPTL